MRSAGRALALPAVAAVLAALVLSSAPAAAQDTAARGIPAIRVFGRDEGIPQSTVAAMAVEATGRVWIGTQAGPAYYDGQGFTRLALPEGAGSSIVWALAAARDGTVWIGTAGGGLFAYRDGRFTSYGEAEGLPAPAVGSLLEATVGAETTIWAGTRRGLAKLVGDRFVRVDLGPEASNARVHALAAGELPAGKPGIWVATGAGLVRCEQGGCAVLADRGAGLPDVAVTAVMEAPGERGRELWAGTHSGVAHLAGGRWETFTKKTSPLPADHVKAFAQTVSPRGKRTTWIATYGGGLARLRDGAWTVIDPSTSGLPSGYVQSLTLGPGGRTLWMGTDGGGLARLRTDGWSAFTARNAPLGGTGYVEAVGEAPAAGGASSTWLALSDGLVRSTDTGWAAVDLRPMAPEGAYVTTFAASRRAPALWIGASVTVGRWSDGTLSPIAPPIPSDFRTIVHTVRESADGQSLWVGTGAGALRLVDGAWQPYHGDGRPLPGQDVFAIVETDDRGGGRSTWFGTNKGLARLPPGGGKPEIHDRSNAPLHRVEVISLAELRDAQGARVLWAGTVGGGVSRYDLDAGTWRETLTETTAVALPDGTVSQIRADARGRIYLFTNRGVARLTPRAPTPADPAEFSVYTFTTEDGLPGDECTGSGALVDARGRIWAGTTAGAAVLDPDEEMEDTAPKPLAPLGAYAGSRGITVGEALRWDDNSVSFDYALLAGFRERDTRYRTELAGFDPAPGPWTADHKARYTNLPPGEYTFRVWGRDYAGNVSEPSAIAFRVRTAPWKTWWAALGYALVAAGLGYGAVRARLRALAQQNRKLEARVQDRTRELDRQVAELARKNAELEASHRRADRIFSALAEALPGTELDGKYRLEARIGQGGFGVVFRARHLALARDVAVKVFRPTQGNDSAAALARFQREGESASLVSHPNAVQVFDAGVSREGMAYLVMELLEGRSLAEELRAVGKLPLARAAAITVQICAALGAAHAKGILHRDIKPENVFLHRGPAREVVKVVDFGIAKLMGLEDSAGDGRETRGVIGTVAYTSPERFKRDPYDARTDVYSVGVTVFEMLSGTLPYPPGERTLLEQLMRQLADPPADLGVVAPDVPADVRRAVMACLNHVPGVRPTLAVLAGVMEPYAGPMPAVSVSSSSLPAPARIDALGATMETPFPAKAPVLDADDGATTLEVPVRPR